LINVELMIYMLWILVGKCCVENSWFGCGKNDAWLSCCVLVIFVKMG